MNTMQLIFIVMPIMDQILLFPIANEMRWNAIAMKENKYVVNRAGHNYEFTSS